MPKKKTRLAKYFEYLDALRESGIVNMYGSPQYLVEAFRIKLDEASKVVGQWMSTFDGKKTPEERAMEEEKS